MLNGLKDLVLKLPGLSRIREKQEELERRERDLKKRQGELDQREERIDQRQAELEAYKSKVTNLMEHFRTQAHNSVDEAPWRHPYLNESNIRRFREYSESVWQFVQEYAKTRLEPLKIAFVINTAQNMYNWGRLAKKYGSDASLFLYNWDPYTLTRPEWEDFDGEYADVSDAAGFLKANPQLRPAIPCYSIPIEGNELLVAQQAFRAGTRKPMLRLLATSPGLRHEALTSYAGFYPYYRWARALADFDILYTAAMPFPAYASGRPYCAFPVGGDLIYDAGRGDDYGQAVSLAFNAARFVMLSNPHPLGHCRRLGLTNGVYLPYPIEDSRYCPGVGRTRPEWEARYGRGIYVLTTARLDRKFKGYGDEFLGALVEVAKRRPETRFIFLNWGDDAAKFREKVGDLGMGQHFIILNPVGKKRLIDYYRSCDIVLDHFVFGYYGATALEAASIGKPVVIKIRQEHYAPLYVGDTMPALNASTPAELGDVLMQVIDHEELRVQIGRQMRDWLVRNHGEARTVPLMLALLRIAADRVCLPKDLINPLLDEESDEEKAYHASCLREIEQSS